MRTQVHIAPYISFKSAFTWTWSLIRYHRFYKL